MAEAMENSLDVGEEAFRKLCRHYERGCSLVSPCCGKVYPCRLCHNDQELSHQIDRQAVSEVECRRCHTQQPVTNTCSKCGLKFGNYFCETCRLYDDTDKGQFHCDGCGLCRVGGRSNFFHCSKCCLCLPHSMLDNHACRQSASKDNCPVCFEDIHSSTNSAHIPRCGHLIHTSCYTNLLEKGLYQCPQCQTSLPDMSQQWLHMDSERASWVMPQHLKDFKVKVKCRDCHKEGDANYHIVGLKCPSCGSYNTVRSGNEEIPMDAAVGGLINQLVQQRRRRRRRRSRQQRNGGGGTDSSSSDSDSDEGGNHGNHHRSDSEDGEDPGNQSRPRPPQSNSSSHHGDGSGEAPTNRPPNEEDNSRSYDGDASENDDIDSNDESSNSDCDSDSDYYEAQRSRTYVSFAQHGYSVFLSPIEVPAGSERGALEWWQDPNDSELDPRTNRNARDGPPESHRGREECDNGAPSSQLQREHSHQHRDHFEPHLVSDVLNSPTEVRRRAIARSIVQNMQLWNSDSESFSELSSEDEEEKSSESWVTEEEEVIVGMRGSELQEQEEVGLQDEQEEEEEEEEDNCRDLPSTTTTMGDIVVHVQSESGVESAESWFTSSDNSHSQPFSHEQDKHTSQQIHLGLCSNETSAVLQLEDQRKIERTSVCSSVSTDDSLAWETACEELPPVCS